MAEEQNESERSIWQNALPYLNMMSELEQAIMLHLINNELRQALEKCRFLLGMLERHLGRKNKTGEKNEDYQSLIKNIDFVRAEVKKLGNLQGVRQAKANEEERIKEMIMNIYEDIGYLMYQHDLVFKKGVAPEDVWARG
jgi:hypothetical protein